MSANSHAFEWARFLNYRQTRRGKKNQRKEQQQLEHQSTNANRIELETLEPRVLLSATSDLPLDLTDHAAIVALPSEPVDQAQSNSVAEFFIEDFEGGLGGFTVDNGFGSGDGLWHLTDGRSLDGDPNHSPINSLYYGQFEDSFGGGIYDTGLSNGGAVFSPLIGLPIDGTIELSFNYLLETEGGNIFDVAEVAIDDGFGFATVLSTADDTLPSSGTAGFWDTATVDLSAFAGQDVTIRWSFDTGDEISNDFEGWYIDDVVITTDSIGVGEPNDTIFDAIDTGIFPGGSDTFFASGEIGDNLNVFPDDDVDLYAVELNIGDELFVDIDAEVFGSSLDSLVRVFDSSGFEVAFSDSDFDSLDPFLEFVAPFSDTYYVGVSAFNNLFYDPFVENSGLGSSTGFYDVLIDVFPGGDPGIEPNDTIFDAIDTEIFPGGNEFFFASGEIGDNPNVFPDDDVDMYFVDLNAGDQLLVDVEAEIFGSSLDSVVRVFDSSGFEVAINDNDFDSLDSFLDFTAAFSDTYYVGVSSFDNVFYDPFIEGSGFGLSTGFYDVLFEVNRGDGGEPNDTISDAIDTEIITGINNSFFTPGVIGDNPNVFPDNDVDLYRVDLNAGDQLLADVDADILGSSLDSILRVFDSAGFEVAFSDDDFESLDSFIDFTAPFSDTYYVGVSSFDNFSYDPFIEDSGFGLGSGFYELFIEVLPEGDLNEPNDTLFDAVDTEIFPGGEAFFFTSAAIGDNPNVFPDDDVDIYRLDLNAGDQLFATVDAEFLGSELDSVLRIFDSSGFEVAFNNDNFGSTDSFIEFIAPFTDTYYVGVSSFNNFFYDPFMEGSGFGLSTGPYDLYLDVFPGDPVEPNDTIFDASETQIFPGGNDFFFTSAEIGDNFNLFSLEDDVDLYRVDLNGGDQLFADIEAEFLGSTLDSVLRIFDSSGNEVANNDDDLGSIDSFIEFTAPFNDTYYVGVSSFDNFFYDPFVEGSGFGLSTGFYELFIDVEPDKKKVKLIAQDVEVSSDDTGSVTGFLDVVIDVPDGLTRDLAAYQVHLEIDPSVSGVSFINSTPLPGAPFENDPRTILNDDGTLFSFDFANPAVLLPTGLTELIRVEFEVAPGVIGDFDVNFLVGDPFSDTLFGDGNANPIELDLVNGTISVTDAPPPVVTDVLVSGSTWSDSFLNEVDPTNGLGFSVPDGNGDQLATLPWINIDQLILAFSEDVDVEMSDLTLIGVNEPIYAFNGFSYDPSTFTAIWELSEPIEKDKLLIHLDDSVVSATSGLSLDGEWDNPDSTSDLVSDVFPSGDGNAGGDFEFRFNVLPGDVNQSVGTNILDLILVVDQVPCAAGQDCYTTLFDVNGDGGINILDLILVVDRVPTTLPAGQPIPLTPLVSNNSLLESTNAIEDQAELTVPTLTAIDNEVSSIVSVSGVSLDGPRYIPPTTMNQFEFGSMDFDDSPIQLVELEEPAMAL